MTTSSYRMMPAFLVLFIVLWMPLVAAAQHGGDAARTVVIRPVANTMAFETTEITAPAGSSIRIVMENTATDPAMQYNVAVLAAAPDDEDSIRAVGLAAMEAGDAAGFIPDHALLLASTATAPPGGRAEVTMTVPPPGEYAFVCLFPGHFLTMRGRLISTP